MTGDSLGPEVFGGEKKGKTWRKKWRATDFEGGKGAPFPPQFLARFASFFAPNPSLFTPFPKYEPGTKLDRRALFEPSKLRGAFHTKRRRRREENEALLFFSSLYVSRALRLRSKSRLSAINKACCASYILKEPFFGFC